MFLAALISQGTRELLERLRPHLDVAIEIFNESLAPTLADRTERPADALRRLTEPAAATPEVGLSPRDALQQALQTGRHRLITSEGVRIGLFPLRHGPRIVGVLAAATPLGADEGGAPADTPLAAADRRLERVGWSLRTTIESDIVKGDRLSEHERRALWLGSALRFLDHLHSCRTEAELFQAILQAAAIWGDVDARIYRRVLDSGYELAAVLPAAGASTPASLPGPLPGVHQGPVRMQSIHEVELLGFGGGAGELFLLPIPPDSGTAEWVLVATGGVDPQLEQVMVTVAHTAGRLLDHLALERSRALHDRLLARLATLPVRVPAQAAALLAEVAASVGATGARLLVREAPDGPARPLATIGGATWPAEPAIELAPTGRLVSATRLVLPLDLSGRMMGLLELVSTGHRFSGGSLQAAEAGAALVEVWLGGVFTGLAQPAARAQGAAISSFEARLAGALARARDAHLEAGLLFVPGQGRTPAGLNELASTLREQLRASDLIGELPGGDLAALVMPAGPSTVDAVASRIARRLEGLLPAPSARLLGRAQFPAAGDTAAALLSAARHDLNRQTTTLGLGPQPSP